MAFKFFRRHQRIVIVIMAVLMVSFLLSFMFRGGPSDRRSGQGPQIAETRHGVLMLRDRYKAKADLELLRLLRMGDPAFWYLMSANGSEADLAYALLIKESRGLGVKVTTSQVNRFFESRGLKGADYDAFLSEIRERHPGISDKSLRSVVTRWLMVSKGFRSGLVPTPPSEPQLRRLYRDLNEKINLRAVRVPAADFLERVTEPDDTAIVNQSNAFGDKIPGSFDQENPFGFGYRRADRVRVQYLFVDRSAIERVVYPSDKQVMDYYIQHRAEFTTQEPTPATAPSEAQNQPGDSGTGPDAEPAQTAPAYSTRELSFSEARDQVFATRKGDMVARALRDITDKAERLSSQLEPPADVNPYLSIQQQMLPPADDMLDRKVDIDISSKPIEEVIGLLGQAAGVRICYPWSHRGETDLDPALRISVKGKGISLGEALERIGDQIKDWPRLEWVRCPALSGALFASAGVQFLPVKAVQTPLLDAQALTDDPILGSSVTGIAGGQSLRALGFGTRALNSEGGGLEVGREGPSMYVTGEVPGRVLWRLSEASPAEALGTITRASQLDDDIARQVADDLKIKDAFALATQRAEEILTFAEADGLEAAAEKYKLEPFETGLFARKVQISPRQQILALAQMIGKMTGEMYLQSLLAQPQMFLFSYITGVQLPQGHPGEHFMSQVFALTPDNVEPPYPQTGQPSVVSIPARAEVLIVERIDYVPAVDSGYARPGPDRPSGRTELFGAVTQIRQWEAMGVWFDFEQIKDRTVFAPIGLVPEAQPETSPSDDREQTKHDSGRQQQPAGST